MSFSDVADACAKLPQQTYGQPISIGVSGSWRVGKSWLVRLIASHLNFDADPQKNTYVVVTFSLWLYQDFEGARSALLQMVGDEVLHRGGQRLCGGGGQRVHPTSGARSLRRDWHRRRGGHPLLRKLIQEIMRYASEPIAQKAMLKGA